MLLILNYCYLLFIWFVASVSSQIINLGGENIPKLQKNTILNTRATSQNNWILQRLDNFDIQNTNTWKMQYFVNDENFASGGPIFIYVGGQTELYEVWLTSGHMYDIGKIVGAIMFATEHRYFGLSTPTPDLSVGNLKYLSSDQALADLAVFVEYIKETYNQLANSKVIMFGSSYGATLATWFRQKYPNLVNGVWASSAPLFAQLNFLEYYPYISSTIFNIGGEMCYRRIERAFSIMDVMIQTGDTQTLQNLFSLATPIDNQDPLDVASFFNVLGLSLGSFIEYTDSSSVIALCTIILDQTVTSDVVAYAEFMDSLYGDGVKIANGYKYLVNVYQNVDWTSQSALIGGRQMLYLYCTQFGWFRTTDFINQGFGNDVTLNSFVQMCSDIFGTQFAMIPDVNRTNTFYGGFYPQVSNVYFTHGELDPYSVFGFTPNLNSLSPSVVIPLVGKSNDLYSISDSDSAELRATKDAATQLILQWIS